MMNDTLRRIVERPTERLLRQVKQRRAVTIEEIRELIAAIKQNAISTADAYATTDSPTARSMVQEAALCHLLLSAIDGRDALELEQLRYNIH